MFNEHKTGLSINMQIGCTITANRVFFFTGPSVLKISDGYNTVIITILALLLIILTIKHEHVMTFVP